MRKLFDKIADEVSVKFPDVSIGKMMSSPGIKMGKKVFAFYYDDNMVFKLGKNYDHSKLKLKEIRFLNPFKNKAPMTAWIVVDKEYSDQWETLTITALEYIRTEK
jgi:TfoX/Sxy family transcriptional regulator of competence genes